MEELEKIEIALAKEGVLFLLKGPVELIDLHVARKAPSNTLQLKRTRTISYTIRLSPVCFHLLPHLPTKAERLAGIFLHSDNFSEQ
jgi:hypothetical protein